MATKTKRKAIPTNDNKVRKNVTLSEETLKHLEDLRRLESRNSISNMIEGLVDRAWNSTRTEPSAA